VRTETKGFLATLAVSAGGAALSGVAAAVVISLYPPGSGNAPPALWGLVVLPVAIAMVLAGVLARTPRSVFLNSLAYLLPQLLAALTVFFLFAHPGGAGGPELILATLEFWVKVAAAYAVVTLLVGSSAWAFRLVRR
jgi:hypothetical protein